MLYFLPNLGANNTISLFFGLHNILFSLGVALNLNSAKLRYTLVFSKNYSTITRVPKTLQNFELSKMSNSSQRMQKHLVVQLFNFRA